MTKNLLNATFLCCFLLPFSATAEAVGNNYQVTDAEKAACGSDAVSLCGDVGEDEDKLLACMKGKRADMSAGCRPVFDEGLHRRGLR